MKTPSLPRQQDAPWLKNRAWARGRIGDATGRQWLASAIFSLILGTVAALALHAAWTAHPFNGGVMGFAVVLAVLALLLLAWTIRLARVRLRFGRSVLELETLPGVIGGYLAGTIHVPARFDAPRGVRLILECVERVDRGTGQNRTVREEDVWNAEQVLKGDLPCDPAGTALPVSFEIPPDALPTSRRSKGQGEILWRLRAKASLPGVNYHAWFTVPVFHVEGAPPGPPKAEALAAKLRK